LEVMKMSTASKLLWERARAGDRSAYDQLFALHRERALLFVRARLGPGLRAHLDSMDVLQDAYLAAHRDFGKFEHTDDGAFLRWLCRIIENRLRDGKDYFGARKRQAVELPRPTPDGPGTEAGRAEHRRKVAEALDQLDEDHRKVLLLRYFEGLSAEEAGEALGRSAGAIRSLTARALAELGKRV
jgi:RNA polymerase sigma-70 factor (ECF subfamily)